MHNSWYEEQEREKYSESIGLETDRFGNIRCESDDDAFNRNWHGGEHDPIESGDIAGG